MKIENNTVPSIIYTLKDGGSDGEIAEVVDRESPFTFLFGTGNLLPEFEKNLEGLEPGKPFEFLIESGSGYGDFNPDAVVDLSKDLFQIDGKPATDLLVEGNFIPMQDDKGNVMQGRVMEIGDDTVKLDFNHPMAGKDLFFSGEVVDVREATSDEIDHGHVHGPGGVQH